MYTLNENKVPVYSHEDLSIVEEAKSCLDKEFSENNFVVSESTTNRLYMKYLKTLEANGFPNTTFQKLR